MSTQENKKIRNATPLEYGGIQFKSVLEARVYKLFKENNFDITYEPTSFVLWEGYKPTIPFFDKNKKTRQLEMNDKKIIDIRYTPDFVVKYESVIAFIEAKGMENDVFYIKKKLFRKLLEDREVVKDYHPMYFEVYTLGHVKQAMTFIKEYAKKFQGDQPSNN